MAARKAGKKRRTTKRKASKRKASSKPTLTRRVSALEKKVNVISFGAGIPNTVKVPRKAAVKRGAKRGAKVVYTSPAVETGSEFELGSN